ncbi:MAG: hypothetical protein Fues2KO_09730 [Fuerstiella sp.]
MQRSETQHTAGWSVLVILSALRLRTRTTQCRLHLSESDGYDAVPTLTVPTVGWVQRSETQHAIWRAFGGT